MFRQSLLPRGHPFVFIVDPPEYDVGSRRRERRCPRRPLAVLERLGCHSDSCTDSELLTDDPTGSPPPGIVSSSGRPPTSTETYPGPSRVLGRLIQVRPRYLSLRLFCPDLTGSLTVTPVCRRPLNVTPLRPPLPSLRTRLTYGEGFGGTNDDLHRLEGLDLLNSKR